MSKKVSTKRTYERYAEDVVAGKIVAGEYIRLACQRFLDDLKREDLIFDYNFVDKVIAFKSKFEHWKGKAARTKFVEEPWQQWIDANIFGFRWKDSGKRRFSLSYTQMARKNGKSFWAASSCEVAFLIDGEPGAEVIFAANSKTQATIAFSMASHLSRQIAKHKPKNTIKVLKDEVYHPKSDSKIIVVAANADVLDGYGPSWVTLDEYHAAIDNSVYEVLQTGMGYREQPHMAVITTAGLNKFGPCYELRNTCIDILRGNIEDDNVFAAIYEMDIDDDWKDEKNWIKANPNIGVTVTRDFLRNQVKKAINIPSSEVSTRTKNLDMWCDSSSTWISSDIVKRQMRKVEWDEFKGKDVIVGTDLGVVCDLTAISAMYRDDDGTFIFRVEYFLPEQHSNTTHAQLYSEWARLGYLHLTGGNVTDYDYITELIASIEESGALIQAVAYDDYNSTQWAIDATERGLPLQNYPQNIGSFNRPTKELERLMLSGKVIFDYNPITEFCFRNVRIKEDHNENQKPVKDQKENKIDGVIASIEALGAWLRDPIYGGGSSI